MVRIGGTFDKAHSKSNCVEGRGAVCDLVLFDFGSDLFIGVVRRCLQFSMEI